MTKEEFIKSEVKKFIEAMKSEGKHHEEDELFKRAEDSFRYSDDKKFMIINLEDPLIPLQ